MSSHYVEMCVGGRGFCFLKCCGVQGGVGSGEGVDHRGLPHTGAAQCRLGAIDIGSLLRRRQAHPCRFGA